MLGCLQCDETFTPIIEPLPVYIDGMLCGKWYLSFISKNLDFLWLTQGEWQEQKAKSKKKPTQTAPEPEETETQEQTDTFNDGWKDNNR